MLSSSGRWLVSPAVPQPLKAPATPSANTPSGDDDDDDASTAKLKLPALAKQLVLQTGYKHVGTQAEPPQSTTAQLKSLLSCSICLDLIVNPHVSSCGINLFIYSCPVSFLLITSLIMSH